MGIRTVFRRLPYWIQSRLTPIRSGAIRASLLGHENADALRLTDVALNLKVESYNVSRWVSEMMIRRLHYHKALDRLLTLKRKARWWHEKAAQIAQDQGPSLVHMFASQAEGEAALAEKRVFDLWIQLRFSHVPVHEYQDRIIPKRYDAAHRRVA